MLNIRSDAFDHLSRIPVRFTFQGESVSPLVYWSGVPEGTSELALICEDGDVPTPNAIVHWLVYGINPRVSALPENLPKDRNVDSPVKVLQGLNSFLFSGYIGPNPGFWGPAHRYHFKLFALRFPSGLGPGAGRTAFFEAIQGKVIEEAQLIGTYAKTLPQKAKAVLFCASLMGGLAFLVLRLRARATAKPQMVL